MIAETTRDSGTIITFYSYKGGTGRSMALANVAFLLGQEPAGLNERVCVIDWDLEAPGLHRYFGASDFPENADRPGIIDYFSHLRECLDERPNLYLEMQGSEGWRILEQELPLSDYIVTTGEGSVDLIKAGRFREQYADRVASFDWADFYRKYHAVYPAFRELLMQRYRWCLIDSRTGLSDVSGVCTMLMPEKLVAAFTPNRQSVEGLLDLVEKAVEYRRHSDDHRPLSVFPLPSRIVTDEHELQKEAHTAYRAKFEECFIRAYGIDACDLGVYFEEVAIPHKGFYGFGELVAVRDDSTTTDVFSINRAYERFYQRLIHLDSAWAKGLDKSSREATFVDVPRQSAADRSARPVVRIFISSTAVDLLDYREKVRDAILRIEGTPVAIETFSAQSGQPADECMKMAASADAVICIVAHRYGYVPPKELGGDGKRSITWLEADAAKNAGKPVFAFLVDPMASWTALKEPDRLTSEPPEKAAEIVKAVRNLHEFKQYLESEGAVSRFSNADELAMRVAISLANFHPKPDRAVTFTTRVWRPLFCHALQPAQHFRGRAAKLQELTDWLQTPVTPDRVVSLIAAGGTGKTALVNEALHEAILSDHAGLFVWSFYEEPNTDNFLREAYLYFTGEKAAPMGGMLERLQIALSGDLPHILVLDGLERVQSEGDRRRRGELEDLQLKRLLRAIAGGRGGARALVTSRFPMVDLDQWTGAGHRVILLDDLERATALEVLRAWKVKGDDATLVRAIEPLNTGDFYHALSVDVLGSYLGNFANGDPGEAPKFSLANAQETDSKARKLSHILEQYARVLMPAERDLLARLALFPRGVEIQLLGWIVQSGGEVAGALVGLSEQNLVTHLERLKNLGLVFRYQANQRIVYSAHPFLRDFFRGLLSAKAESIHESVRVMLAPSLQLRLQTKPTDTAILDQYELLIEQTLLAGRFQEAFDLYKTEVGGYENLGWILGENARGLRILERFVSQDDFSHIEHRLSLPNQFMLINDFGLFARNMGDLARARSVFVYGGRLSGSASDQRYKSRIVANLADVEFEEGHFRRAVEYSESALTLPKDRRNELLIASILALRAVSLSALGDVAAAAAEFARAIEVQSNSVVGARGIQAAEWKFLQGDRSGARLQIQADRQIAVANNWNDALCRCNALLARLLIPDDPIQAAWYLQEARAFANHSGNVELQLRCFHSACELHRNLGDYPQGIAEAEAGILLADTCGFGKYSIDLRLVFAETLLAAGDARKAMQNARWALDRSEQADCLYAWGQADGLQFCGLAHLRLGEHKLARERLTAALELRERLGHGSIEETRRALAQLGA